MIKRFLMFVLMISQVFWFVIDVKAYTTAEAYTFHQYNYGQNIHILNGDDYFSIPDVPTFFSMYIPNIDFIKDKWLAYPAGSSTLSYVSARLYLWDETFKNTTSINMEYLKPYQEDYGVYLLDEPTLSGFNIDQYSWGYLSLIVVYSGETRVDILDWLNARVRVKFDDEIGSPVSTGLRVTYVDRENVFYTTRHIVDGIPDMPPSPMAQNLVFMGWRTVDNSLYDFDEVLDPDVEFGDYATLYATWQFVPAGAGTITPSDNIFNTVLSSMGMNNVAGRLLAFVVIAILLIVGGYWMTLPSLVITMVMTVYTGFAVYLGWLPVYALIVIGMGLLFVMLKDLKGGGS